MRDDANTAVKPNTSETSVQWKTFFMFALDRKHCQNEGAITTEVLSPLSLSLSLSDSLFIQTEVTATASDTF